MNKLMSVAVAASLAMTALGAGVATTVQADQVKVPVMSQGDRQSMALPQTGQTRETVRQRFGDPARTSGPVGDPLRRRPLVGSIRSGHFQLG